MIFDPLYFLILAPGLVLALWAQWRMHSAFRCGKQILAASRITGAEAAAKIMRAAGVTGVSIEQVEGVLTDHYDPRHKVLRLSSDVYSGRSLSAVGIAAHEAGHAIQDAKRYPLLVVRNGLVPMASIGSNLAWVLMMVGFTLMSMQLIWGQSIILLGIAAFSMTVLFQLVNLPVEFDASRRARLMLVSNRIVTEQEAVVVNRVLNAAAMTYVAATATAILSLLYFLLRSGLLGKR